MCIVLGSYKGCKTGVHRPASTAIILATSILIDSLVVYIWERALVADDYDFTD